MTFQPDQPQDLPPPQISVDTLRQNFSSYADVFDNNHVAMNAARQGMHNALILEKQLADPNINDNFCTIYNKDNGVADLQAFIKIPQFLPNQKPNTPMKLTYASVNTAGPVYQSFLVGGYLIYFGQVTQLSSVGPTPIPILVTLTPAPSKILCVIANTTNIEGLPPFWGQPFSVNVLSNFEFNINPTGTNLLNYQIPWIAIGKE